MQGQAQQLEFGNCFVFRRHACTEWLGLSPDLKLPAKGVVKTRLGSQSTRPVYYEPRQRGNASGNAMSLRVPAGKHHRIGAPQDGDCQSRHTCLMPDRVVRSKGRPAKRDGEDGQEVSRPLLQPPSTTPQSRSEHSL